MQWIEFEWDPPKAKRNIKFHGVSFDEAKTVFYDENAILIRDPEHSQDEDRFLMLGQSFKPRLLVVVHCYRENDEVVRIISARKATKTERKTYTGRKS